MKMSDVIGCSMMFVWLVTGMFVGVGLYMLLKQPMLSFFLILFAIGLMMICYFLLMCFGELNRKDKIGSSTKSRSRSKVQ